MKYYIYQPATMIHLGTVISDTCAACEAVAAALYAMDGELAAGTYSPAFGCLDGLVESDDAREYAE